MAAPEGLNGLLDRLRKQASQSPAPQAGTNTGSTSSLPPQQQYHREERVNSAPISYSNDPPFFSSYQPYGQPPAKSQTPPTYNPSVPLPSTGQTDPSRTASLLGLLKFTQAPSAVAPDTTVPIPRETILSPPPLAQSSTNYVPPTPASRPTNAQDLVASLLARSGQVGASAPVSSAEQLPYNISNAASETTTGTRSPSSAPVNPQDLVLQLLNRPKPPQGDHAPNSGAENAEHEQSINAEAASSPMITTRAEEPLHRPQPQANRTPSPAAENSNMVSSPGAGGSPQAITSQVAPVSPAPSAPISGQNKTLFTYVNPFEQLHALHPKTRTPKQNSPGPNGVQKRSMIPTPVNPVEIPLPFSPKVEPTGVEVEDTDVLHQMDMRLKAKMEKKEEEKTQIASDQSLQHEREQASHSETSEQRDIVEHNSHQYASGNDMSREASIKEGHETQESPKDPTTSSDVIDRDEDEDTDYVEPQGPIKVFNFPMKPFSAITINADIPSSMRPRFPFGKMSDIARMPRQFDQLDRNLIAASPSYIVYAISKSNGRGGIRVLRQEDGKDRVLNKDTMDRTFNVVIGRGERVLGTAVSGAVLWADIGEGFEAGDW